MRLERRKGTRTKGGLSRVRGRTCHPPLFHRLLPLIAHWPAIALWNRDDESTYNLSPVTSGN